ncbi:hypothetical protein A5M85_07270 [Cellulophaga lytica]|nr:hypothetical protein A5M85_07270 [Cellulophaga lytica]
MSGTLIGQAIPFFATFFLTRIFTPEDFGVFAIFISIVNILGTISTGRYEMAILLPKRDETAFNLVKISIIISALFCLLILFVIYVFYDFFFNISKNVELIKYIYYLPLSVFGFAVFKIFAVWFTRIKKYKKISLSIIVKSIFGVFFNIGIGYYFGMIGLFLGSVFSSLIAVLIINPITLNNYKIGKKCFLSLLKEYRKFPIYDVPTSFVYILAKNGIILIINKGFLPVITGYYSLTERLLIAPTQVFVGSYTQVYNQQVTEKFNNKENISLFVLSNIKKVSKILILPFILGTYLSEYLIPFFLGDKWIGLHKYIYILSPLIYFSMILNPLGYVLKIKDRQDISFVQHLILTFVKLGSLSLCIFFLKFNIFKTLLIYAILSIATLTYNTNVILKVLDLQIKKRFLLYLISMFCIIVSVFNYFFL